MLRISYNFDKNNVSVAFWINKMHSVQEPSYLDRVVKLETSPITMQVWTCIKESKKAIKIRLNSISFMKEINIDRVYPLNRHQNIKILHDFSPLKSISFSDASLDMHLNRSLIS